jgi:hypothetical protein
MPTILAATHSESKPQIVHVTIHTVYSISKQPLGSKYLNYIFIGILKKLIIYDAICPAHQILISFGPDLTYPLQIQPCKLQQKDYLL